MSSKRNMVLTGFVLSLISITFNSVVITYVNGRLKTVDDERSKLMTSLERQAALDSESQASFDTYRLMHNLIFAMPSPDKAEDVSADSASILAESLEKMYQAAYDVTPIELMRARNEYMKEMGSLGDKLAMLDREKDSARSPKVKRRLEDEQRKLQEQNPPKSELMRQIFELDRLADDVEAAGADEGEGTLFFKLHQVMEPLNAKNMESSEKKRARISELDEQRSSLVRKSSYASYGALVFQILGLMLILAKDLLSDKKPAADTKAS